MGGKKRTTKPTLEEFNNFSKFSKRKYRMMYPGEYPDPVYTKWGRIPTLEEYQSKCKQYQYFLRKKHPGVYQEPRPWGTNREQG